MSEPQVETPAGGRVLLVDDAPDVLRAFSRALQAGGYDVDTAPTGFIAAQLLEQERYDVVVSDIAMPEFDGMELLRRVRAKDLDLPVILATGGPTLDTAIEAVELRAMRYLTKPIRPSELRAVVARAVRLRRLADLRQQLAEAAGQVHGNGDLTALQVHFEGALDALYMQYQPIVSWSKRQVIGYEALVRSGSPHLPHPGALIDAAERLDRLPALGRAIRALCPQPMPDTPDDVLLFVNLHTRDLLDPALYHGESPLSAIAHRVVLEVTERAKLEQVDGLEGRIATLREQGYRIAIDDIGAGYAGLNSFAQLEPEVVKLDMLLVRDVDQRPTKQRLIRSLCALCQELGMRVVAEGVETAAERDTVIDLGCDWLQGYLFAKPAPPFIKPCATTFPPLA